LLRLVGLLGFALGCAFAGGAQAAPCLLGSPLAVITPTDGEASLAYDGLSRTAWTASDHAQSDCSSQPNYADPTAKVTLTLPRPLVIDWMGALTEASARGEGISDVGRETRTRLSAQPFRAEDWQLLGEWRQQDNGQYGTMTHPAEWRMANNVPNMPVGAVSFEVAATAFANCDNDVVGEAWGSVALYEILFHGHDAYPGDVDLDGKVDLTDFGKLKENFGTAYGPADFDQNGKVDLTDFGILKENFGRTYPPQTAVPEPTTWALAMLGGALLALKRLRRLR